jgi:hypothetical protein
MTEFVDVKIPGWEKYNGRKDVTHHSWFRLQNSLFEDHELFHLNPEELCFFIYLLSLASKKNSAEIRVSLSHATAVARFSKAKVISAIDKLVESRVLIISEPSRGRNANVTLALADVTGTVATYERTNEHNEHNKQTGESITLPAVAGSLPALASLWNETMDPLFPKVEVMSSSSKRRLALKQRWKEKPDLEFWKAVLSRINASSFCRGSNDRHWVASIDFVARTDTAAKVLEGQYDDKGSGKSRPTGLSREELERIWESA